MDFGERTKERIKNGAEVPVVQMPKYQESKKKAEELIMSGRYGLSEADFWILKHETKTQKVSYDGLIISHNGCLKINAALPAELKFKPECASAPMEAFYTNGMIQIYVCPEQGIYEVGEVTDENCKNAYPYAMVIKRLFDRVVLKTSQVAFAGIYGEDEADEFRRRDDDEPKADPKPEQKTEPKPDKEEPKKLADEKVTQVNVDALLMLINEVKAEVGSILEFYQVASLKDMTMAQWKHCMDVLTRRKNGNSGKGKEQGSCEG